MFLDQFLFELSCKNTETHTHTYCGESDSENAPIITQSREDAEVRQICERRAGQRGNWTVEFIL